jgi:hypothetical protein
LAIPTIPTVTWPKSVGDQGQSSNTRGNVSTPSTETHQQESFLMLLEITVMIWAALLVIFWLNC